MKLLTLMIFASLFSFSALAEKRVTGPVADGETKTDCPWIAQDQDNRKSHSPKIKPQTRQDSSNGNDV